MPTANRPRRIRIRNLIIIISGRMPGAVQNDDLDLQAAGDSIARNLTDLGNFMKTWDENDANWSMEQSAAWAVLEAIETACKDALPDATELGALGTDLDDVMKDL